MNAREAAHEQLQAVLQHRLEIRSSKGERARRREELISAREEKLLVASARSLIPGEPAVDDRVMDGEIAALSREIQELEKDEPHLENAIREARDRYEKALQPEIRDRVSAVVAARARAYSAMTELGRDALKKHGDAAAQISEYRSLSSELDGLLGQVGGTPQERHRSRSAVRAFLTKKTPQLNSEVIAGYIVWSMLRWSQLSSSPLELFWREQGRVNTRASVLNTAVMTEDEIFQLKAGRLPI